MAAKRAKVPLLTDDEIDHLLEIYASPPRFIGVDVGDEIVLSCDGTGMKTHATRIQDLQSYEQWMGADLLELCVGDYSLKVVRTILAYEAQYMHDALLCTVAPLQYGVMPNLGLYSKPDGPCDNWNELLPLGKIPEARAAAGGGRRDGRRRHGPPRRLAVRGRRRRDRLGHDRRLRRP